MVVNQEKCNGCGICTPYCPNEAIQIRVVEGSKRKASILQDKCMECGNCIRTRVVRCPAKAFYELPKEELSLGRQMRRYFSDPSKTHPLTGVPGRGTEEVKTNDVTARVCRGELGICLELGRPVVGTTGRDIEKITMRLAELGIATEPCNPVTEMIADEKTGKFKDEYRDEVFVSAIVEFVVPFEKGKEVLLECKKMADECDTVFSLDLLGVYEEDGSLPALALCEEVGMSARPNSKVNIGMGRPFFAGRRDQRT